MNSVGHQGERDGGPSIACDRARSARATRGPARGTRPGRRRGSSWSSRPATCSSCCNQSAPGVSTRHTSHSDHIARADSRRDGRQPRVLSTPGPPSDLGSCTRLGKHVDRHLPMKWKVHACPSHVVSQFSPCSSHIWHGVQKPIQYVGGELNSVTKEWEDDPGPLGADVPRRLRGRPAQPGGADPLRGAQRARGSPRRAHLRGVAGHGVGHARARHPAVHRRRPPPRARIRRLRDLLRHRARLHQHAHRARPRRHPAARGRPDRGRPDRPGRRARRVQPRAGRGLRRRRRARRRRGDRARDHRGDPRVEGRGASRRPRRGAAAARGERRRLRAEVLRRDVRRRAVPCSARRPTVPAYPTACASTP